MIKNIFSWPGVRSLFPLLAIAEKHARSSGLSAGAPARGSTPRPNNAGKESL